MSRTVSRESPYAARRDGSIVICTSVLEPPMTLARATSGSCSSLGRRTCSASRCKEDVAPGSFGSSDLRIRPNMGARSGSVSSNTGRSLSGGRRTRCVSSRSRAVSIADCRSAPQSSSTVTSDSPSREIERTCTAPGRFLSVDSSGSVISRATISGGASGQVVHTVILGISSGGRRLTGRRVSAMSPIRTAALVRQQVATGRRTAIWGSIMIVPRPVSVL